MTCEKYNYYLLSAQLKQLVPPWAATAAALSNKQETAAKSFPIAASRSDGNKKVKYHRRE